MKTSTSLVIFGSALLGLSACVRTRAYAPPGASSPASAESQVAAYTPPPNPLTTPLAPIDPAPGSAGHTHPAHAMPGMEPESESPSGLTVYTCPMHADVRSDRPGDCPKCGMALVPMRATTGQSHPHGGTP